MLGAGWSRRAQRTIDSTSKHTMYRVMMHLCQLPGCGGGTLGNPSRAEFRYLGQTGPGIFWCFACVGTDWEGFRRVLGGIKQGLNRVLTRFLGGDFFG